MLWGISGMHSGLGGGGIWKDSIRNGSKWYSSIEEGGW